MSIKVHSKKRALIVGGSLGGLFAGAMLQQAGWDVDIFERSPRDLDSRGGGIVLQPEVVELIRRSGIEQDWNNLGVRSARRIFYRPDGSVEHALDAPQVQTSWSRIYSLMRSTVDDDRYHKNQVLKDIRFPESDRVTALFEDGSEQTGDLLIGADGSGSQVRKLLWDDVPEYAGYIAWRGLVPETDMPELARTSLHGDFAFANNTGSHILGYLVPGENSDLRPGHRLYNWVWYRVVSDLQREAIMTGSDGISRSYSVPEGLLKDSWKAHLRDEAVAFLPPGFRDIVKATREPFAQAIRDLAVEKMVKGRTILLGDAASIPRPHTAASTSKAAANALALADALSAFPDDTDRALAKWEGEQVLRGKYLRAMGTSIGNRLMFGEAAILS
ncbi:FAD-dependent monooxygenase [uncultured Pluralibacter sp.]|uniref:FAD binding domain-containing protein n=1 Tax=uncultured Pluralibacter sp. TaxID=1490864 RepID=UPI00261A9A03|nr:FAD-dependent monooxygenase [uncultured Pluralibacter sp.]